MIEKVENKFACLCLCENLKKKEVRKMRKLLGLMLVLGLMATAVYAVNPCTCKLTVTPSGVYSVSIDTQNVTRTFGTVAVNTNSTIWIATVTNDGTLGCDMTALSSNADSDAPDVDWTIAATVGTNQYRLQVGTGGGGGITANVIETNAADTEITGAQTIAAGSTVGLFGKIFTPTTSTSSDQFTITLSIYATAVD